MFIGWTSNTYIFTVWGWTKVAGSGPAGRGPLGLGLVCTWLPGPGGRPASPSPAAHLAHSGGSSSRSHELGSISGGWKTVHGLRYAGLHFKGRKKRARGVVYDMMQSHNPAASLLGALQHPKKEFDGASWTPWTRRTRAGTRRTMVRRTQSVGRGWCLSKYKKNNNSEWLMAFSRRAGHPCSPSHSAP